MGSMINHGHHFDRLCTAVCAQLSFDHCAVPISADAGNRVIKGPIIQIERKYSELTT